MKEGWKIYTLGELCKFQRGLTYSKGDEVAFSKNVVLRSNNVDLDTKSLDFSELKYLREDFIIPEDRKVKEGCFLICVSNGSKKHLGKAALIDKNYGYAFGGFMGLLVPDQSIVSSKYLWTILASQRYAEFIKHLSDGAGINNLKFDDIAPFEVPVPPLSEQEKIVSFLDAEFAKIDALKANTEQQLQAAKDLFQSALREYLTPKEGWKEMTLCEICEFEGGAQPPKNEWIKKPLSGFVRMLQIRDFTKSRDVEIEYVKMSRKLRLCKSDDILLGRYGASVGKILTGLEGAYNVAIIKSIPNTNYVLKTYIRRYFESQLFQSRLLKVCHSRTAQAGFSKEDIGDFPVPIPSSLKEQQQIVDLLDTLSDKVARLQENYNKTLVLCNDLKQSLLKSIFE